MMYHAIDLGQVGGCYDVQCHWLRSIRGSL